SPKMRNTIRITITMMKKNINSPIRDVFNSFMGVHPINNSLFHETTISFLIAEGWFFCLPGTSSCFGRLDQVSISHRTALFAPETAKSYEGIEGRRIAFPRNFSINLNR
ncbi:MAG: hypothetical protein ONB13_02405, partial [candidate division KSB1 bacterium]|nr:hypothetical protein [candidate division KSB1 bacterium]